jgi:hypothetical protein
MCPLIFIYLGDLGVACVPQSPLREDVPQQFWPKFAQKN